MLPALSSLHAVSLGQWFGIGPNKAKPGLEEASIFGDLTIFHEYPLCINETLHHFVPSKSELRGKRAIPERKFHFAGMLSIKGPRKVIPIRRDARSCPD